MHRDGILHVKKHIKQTDRMGLNPEATKRV
jgi:hypothetical protein